MKIQVYKCDLCGTKTTQKNDELKIKVKHPNWKWEFIQVTDYLDLCDDCEDALLEKIRELEKKKEDKKS